VARQLREALPDKVQVESVTGLLPPSEREARIASLVAEPGQYVLVCTDCLAEGINLQQHSMLCCIMIWPGIRPGTNSAKAEWIALARRNLKSGPHYYGTDNPIDGVILDVLIRKHKRIKSDLGVTVAVPGSSEQIAEALFEGRFFEKERSRVPAAGPPLHRELEPKKKALHAEWENAET